MAKREYKRRSDKERIEELQAKIESLEKRVSERKHKDSPVHREAKKIQRALRRFAQVAIDNGRADLANSTQAFAAGLQRSLTTEVERPEARRGPSPADDGGESRARSA